MMIEIVEPSVNRDAFAVFMFFTNCLAMLAIDGAGNRNVLSSFQSQVDTDRQMLKQSPLTWRAYFWPPSNAFTVLSFWFFWAQITAISFVPRIDWSVTWWGEFWSWVGELFLWTLFDFDFTLFDVDWPEIDIYTVQFWIAVGIAVLFPPLTRAYHNFFAKFKESQSELIMAQSASARALAQLEERTKKKDRLREDLAAIENEIDHHTRQKQLAEFKKEGKRRENVRAEEEMEEQRTRVSDAKRDMAAELEKELKARHKTFALQAKLHWVVHATREAVCDSTASTYRNYKTRWLAHCDARDKAWADVLGQQEAWERQLLQYAEACITHTGKNLDQAKLRLEEQRTAEREKKKQWKAKEKKLEKDVKEWAATRKTQAAEQVKRIVAAENKFRSDMKKLEDQFLLTSIKHRAAAVKRGALPLQDLELRESKLCKGDPVQTWNKGSRRIDSGELVAGNADGTWDVKFGDGYLGSRVPAASIKKHTKLDRFKEGVRTRVNLEDFVLDDDLISAERLKRVVTGQEDQWPWGLQVLDDPQIDERVRSYVQVCESVQGNFVYGGQERFEAHASDQASYIHGTPMQKSQYDKEQGYMNTHTSKQDEYFDYFAVSGKSNFRTGLPVWERTTNPKEKKNASARGEEYNPQYRLGETYYRHFRRRKVDGVTKKEPQYDITGKYRVTSTEPPLRVYYSVSEQTYSSGAQRAKKGESMLPLCVGDPVETWSKASKRDALGKLAANNGDGTWDVKFDDGDRDPRVPGSSIKKYNNGYDAARDRADKSEGKFDDMSDMYKNIKDFADDDGHSPLEQDLQNHRSMLARHVVPRLQYNKIEDGGELKFEPFIFKPGAARSAEKSALNVCNEKLSRFQEEERENMLISNSTKAWTTNVKEKVHDDFWLFLLQGEIKVACEQIFTVQEHYISSQVALPCSWFGIEADERKKAAYEHVRRLEAEWASGKQITLRQTDGQGRELYQGLVPGTDSDGKQHQWDDGQLKIKRAAFEHLVKRREQAGVSAFLSLEGGDDELHEAQNTFLLEAREVSQPWLANFSTTKSGNGKLLLPATISKALLPATISTAWERVSNAVKSKEEKARDLVAAKQALAEVELAKEKAEEELKRAQTVADEAAEKLKKLGEEKDDVKLDFDFAKTAETTANDELQKKKEDVSDQQLLIKKTTIGKRKCGSLYAFFDAFTALLYMGIMRILAKGLACQGFNSSYAPRTNVTVGNLTGACLTERECMISLPEEECFTGRHLAIAPCALVGIICLYPSAILTRPLFQALDPKLNLRFDYNYLFFFAQIQTLLLLCSAFFKNSPAVLLSVCLVADVLLIWYFKAHEPCTSHNLNCCAYRYELAPRCARPPASPHVVPCLSHRLRWRGYRAFGFSACMNIAAFAVIETGEDYGPSIFLFVYVGWVIWVVIWTIQARWFPNPTNAGSEYEFLRHPTEPQRIQIAMSIRTECIVRALDIMSDIVFFYDGV
eukprot:g540.t1